MNRVLSIILIYFFLFGSLKSQEQLGLRLENYSGINAVYTNPANSFLTPYSWDVNVISAGVFFNNNYLYLKNTSTFKLLKNIRDINIEYDSKNKTKEFYRNKTVFLDFYDRMKKSFFSLSGILNGPSFFIRINENNSIAFVSAYRFFGSLWDIPKELSFYSYYNKPYYQSFPISSFNSGFISWQEYGINYVNKIKGYSSNTLLGVTVKYLVGNDAMFFENKKIFQFQQLPHDSIAAIDRLDLQFGYTDSNFKFYSFPLRNNGSGASIDLGATMIFGEGINDYKFRIGVSLLDLGFITFDKNSYKYMIDVDTTTKIDVNEFSDAFQSMTLMDINEVLSRQIFMDPHKTLIANSFKMWLPVALSIQFDYSFSKLIYLNGTLYQGLTRRAHSVKRESLLAVSPRIEHRWFSFSTPLILYNWKDFRLGTSVRLAYIVIGTDDLYSLFTNHARYSGSDLFIGIKFNPFPMGKRNHHMRNLNRNIKCYEF